MAEQVRRSVASMYRNASGFGGDANQIRDFDLPADTVKGGMCCSGMFDLKPVRLSARRHDIDFSDEMEEALSPQRRLGDLNAPPIVAYGTLETPEFSASVT